MKRIDGAPLVPRQRLGDATRRAAVGCALLLLASSALAACRRGESNKLFGSKPELPPSATAVASPTAGIEPPAPVAVPPAHPGAPSGAPASFAPLVKTAGDAVVTVVIKVRKPNGRSSMRGLGSGFLIDKSGTILTNNHVVAGGNAIDIVLQNDKVVEGKVLGTDPGTDVAVVKIEPPEGIAPIPLGDSDAAQVGDWVVAIGNPLGLSHTVTAGILSAKGRTTKDVPLHAVGGGDEYFDFLQTDAAINPGNSGGPLLNLKSECIGINTAINREGQGLAFAIPINMVKQMLPSLIKEGRLVRSYLGVGIRDAPLDSTQGARGALVTKVWRGTPADGAGIKPNDRILAVDGVAVRDSSQMRWLVSIAGVGRKVTLRIVRGDRAFDLPITLEKLPEGSSPAAPTEEDDEEDGFGFPPVGRHP